MSDFSGSFLMILDMKFCRSVLMVFCGSVDPLLSLAIIELTLDSGPGLGLSSGFSVAVSGTVAGAMLELILLSGMASGSAWRLEVATACLLAGTSCPSLLNDNLFTTSEELGLGERTGGLGEIFRKLLSTTLVTKILRFLTLTT